MKTRWLGSLASNQQVHSVDTVRNRLLSELAPASGTSFANVLRPVVCDLLRCAPRADTRS